MRVSAAALFFIVGCVGDPKVDPCRNGACEHDAAISADAGRDARADAQIDAAVGTELDAARDLDSGMVPRHDAAPSDAQPRVLALQGDLGVHDPTIIEAGGTFTIFSTGAGIRVKRSSDLINWQDDGRVFASNPEWIAQQVPGATDLWAPEIARFGDAYHLYYSASTFGSRTSCIGHATATNLATLDFVDHGPVVCTRDSDDYNAIDPALLLDDNGSPWLAFGSFWTGIKLIKLADGGQRDGVQLLSLAARPQVQAIEAPYFVKRDGYYYLFVSFDLCCRGASSTYRIMVGRSRSITGPYVDAEGKAMSTGGGSMVVLGNQRWRGPGHNAVLTTADDQYLVYHAYDADHDGAPTLRISELLWNSDGWPIPGGP